MNLIYPYQPYIVVTMTIWVKLLQTHRPVLNIIFV